MKRKIEDLEEHIRQVEDDNSLLRDLNEVFGKESDNAHKENEILQEELNRYRQFCIPRSLTGSTERPKKMLKLKEKSPDEKNKIGARVRIILQVSLQPNLC
jgi:hypothetical protein